MNVENVLGPRDEETERPNQEDAVTRSKDLVEPASETTPAEQAPEAGAHEPVPAHAPAIAPEAALAPPAAPEIVASPVSVVSVETDAHLAPAQVMVVESVGVPVALPEQMPAVDAHAPTETAEDEEIIIKVPKRKKATPKAEGEAADKPKVPRKAAKKAIKLPDPGDGSGYEAPQTAEGVDATEGSYWYAVHCYSGYENKVKHNLEQRIESIQRDHLFQHLG